MGVVYVKIIQQLSLKVVDRTKVPALEKTAGQHPKPPCHLIEPRPVFGRKMQPRLLRRIAPERPPRHAALQGLRDAGESTPGRHEAAKFQAPVRLEMIDHPVIGWHGREVSEHVGQMCGKVLTGAGWAKMPQHLAGPYVEQDPAAEVSSVRDS